MSKVFATRCSLHGRKLRDAAALHLAITQCLKARPYCLQNLCFFAACCLTDAAFLIHPSGSGHGLFRASDPDPPDSRCVWGVGIRGTEKLRSKTSLFQACTAEEVSDRASKPGQLGGQSPPEIFGRARRYADGYVGKIFRRLPR